MKVVAFNGSPRKEGNTYHSLMLVGAELERENIDFEIIHVGNKMIRGCLACGMCRQNKNERCVINDEVNDWIQCMKNADGIILGSPVHYSGIASTMKSFLDRAFYVATGGSNNLLRHKVGASVVAVRRSGGVPTFDGLNHYINYAEMIMPGSNYWNVAHGTAPGEVSQDEEGQQVMRILGKNMAWLLKVLAAGKSQVEPVPPEQKKFTNFIR